MKAMQDNQLESKLSTKLNISLDPKEIEELCSDLGKQDMSYTYVQIADATAVVYKRELKLSFSDKLAAFGGTMGLFTGMSLLSFFEVIFWTLKCVLSICTKK